MQILPTSQAQLVLKWKMGKERHPYKVPLKNVTAKQQTRGFLYKRDKNSFPFALDPAHCHYYSGDPGMLHTAARY